MNREGNIGRVIRNVFQLWLGAASFGAAGCACFRGAAGFLTAAGLFRTARLAATGSTATGGSAGAESKGG